MTLEVECPGMELITRALDPTQESAVHDLNIYFFSRKFPDDIARHVYTNGGVSRVPVDLFPADYDMYVIANVGRDLGERSREQIAGYTATVASEQELTRAGRLPMAVHQEVSVTGDASLSVNLVRCVAKIDLSLSVAPALRGHLVLRSVRLCGAQRSCKLFGENRLAEAERIDYSKQSLSGDSFNGSYYLNV